MSWSMLIVYCSIVVSMSVKYIQQPPAPPPLHDSTEHHPLLMLMFHWCLLPHSELYLLSQSNFCYKGAFYYIDMLVYNEATHGRYVIPHIIKGENLIVLFKFAISNWLCFVGLQFTKLEKITSSAFI